VNIMQFCQAFNAATQDKMGTIIPVEITVYEDRSFDFITKTPPAAVLLKQAAGIESGSGTPNRTKVATVTRDSSADRRDQDARPERERRRRRDEDHRRHRPFDGHRDRRVARTCASRGRAPRRPLTTRRKR
jgi:hypothetical protein